MDADNVESSELAVVDIEVERLATVLSVVLRPVESELTPAGSELLVVEVEVEVERLAVTGGSPLQQPPEDDWYALLNPEDRHGRFQLARLRFER
ncbi:hypothetical protein JCM10599A_21530 [Paraburkholderia kururiensis]